MDEAGTLFSKTGRRLLIPPIGQINDINVST